MLDAQHELGGVVKNFSHLSLATSAPVSTSAARLCAERAGVNAAPAPDAGHRVLHPRQ
jgi:hypothetical protein